MQNGGIDNDKIKVQTRIHLNKFSPRHYQLDICRSIATEGGKYKKLLLTLPRRAGKDLLMWNLMIRAAIKDVGNYSYCLPTFGQARSVIWESITNTGERFLDYIPKELIKSINNVEMKIVLFNGSIIKLIGSDSYDTSIVGTNPRMIVFSEYALADENAYKLAALPILRANDGVVALVSTPRGKNHMYELYQIAKESPDWYCSFLTVEDTQHISIDEIKKEIASGEISEDLAMQEYWCSYEMGQEGSYYAKYLDKMKLKGQIGVVPWEPYYKVHTAWDLGIKDPTVIIFYQVVGQIVRIIDYYEASDRPADHFARVVLNKEYTYGYHFPPHDIMVRELSTGLSRREAYKNLGIKFTEPVVIDIEDGIELCRRSFSKIWIDAVACKKLIKSLENYREEFDIKRKVYRGRPLHDHTSHACFVGSTNVLTRIGMRQIMNIEEGEEVLTLSGWKKCLKSICNKKDAILVEVSFQDGTKVKCTPDHLFLTESGWISAQSLKKDTKIQSSSIKSLNTLKEACISYGLMRGMFQKPERDFIETSLGERLGKYLVDIKSIIEIIIPSITTYGTLSVYRKKIILNCLDQIIRDLPKVLGMPQQSGTHQKREDCGIKGTRSEPKAGKNGKENRENVYYVIRNLNALFEAVDFNRNFATQIAKPLIIEDVKLLSEKADVWDITVPGIGHFSLENGAIVHNSDAFRYLCASLPKTKDGTSAQELEKRFQEARLGPNANMPAIFRDDLPPY